MDDKEKSHEPVEVSDLGGEAHKEESTYGVAVIIEEEECGVFVGEPIGDSNGDVASNEEYEVRTSEDNVGGLCGLTVPDNLIDVVKDGEDSLTVGEGGGRDESTTDFLHYEGDRFCSVAVGEVEKGEESVSSGLTLQSSVPVNTFLEERDEKEDYDDARESNVDKQEGFKEARLDSGSVSITKGEAETRNSCEYHKDEVKTSPPDEDEDKVVYVTEGNIESIRKKPVDGQEKLCGGGYISLEKSNRDDTVLCEYNGKSFKNEKERVEDEDDDDWGDFAAAEMTGDVRRKGEEEFGSCEDAHPGTISVPELVNKQPDGGWDANFHDIQEGIDSITMQQEASIDSDPETIFASRATEIFSDIPSVEVPQMLSYIVNKDEFNPPPVPCVLREVPPWNPLQGLEKWIGNFLLSRIPPVSDAVEVEEEETGDLYGASTHMNTQVKSSSVLLDLTSEDLLSQPSCSGSANGITVVKGEVPQIVPMGGGTVSSAQVAMTKDGLPDVTLTREGLMSEDNSVNSVPAITTVQVLSVKTNIANAPSDGIVGLEEVNETEDLKSNDVVRQFSYDMQGVHDVAIPDISYMLSDTLQTSEIASPVCQIHPSCLRPGESSADFPHKTETFGM